MIKKAAQSKKLPEFLSFRVRDLLGKKRKTFGKSQPQYASKEMRLEGLLCSLCETSIESFLYKLFYVFAGSFSKPNLKKYICMLCGGEPHSRYLVEEVATPFFLPVGDISAVADVILRAFNPAPVRVFLHSGQNNE